MLVRLVVADSGREMLSTRIEPAKTMLLPELCRARRVNGAITVIIYSGWKSKPHELELVLVSALNPPSSRQRDVHQADKREEDRFKWWESSKGVVWEYSSHLAFSSTYPSSPRLISAAASYFVLL